MEFGTFGLFELAGSNKMFNMTLKVIVKSVTHKFKLNKTQHTLYSCIQDSVIYMYVYTTVAYYKQ